MMTTANYVLVAYVGGEQYHFEYEDCGDMWEALQEFFFDDYPEILIDIDKAGEFPIDVLAMDGGKAIRRYEVAFHSVLFDHFFGKGHTVDSIYTLDDFGKDIKDVRSRLDAEKPRMSELLDRVSDDVLTQLWRSTTEAVSELHGDTPLGECELLGNEHFCNLLQLSLVAFETWRVRELKKMENEKQNM